LEQTDAVLACSRHQHQQEEGARAGKAGNARSGEKPVTEAAVKGEEGGQRRTRSKTAGAEAGNQGAAAAAALLRESFPVADACEAE
jgi:hypothetical protein